MGQPLSSILTAKLRSLQEAIQEIDAEIASRQAHSRQFLQAIATEISRVQTLLSFLGEPWSKGYLPAFEELRITLVRELATLTSRYRAEELRAWEDLAALKQQRREYLMEYQSLQNTAALLRGERHEG